MCLVSTILLDFETCAKYGYVQVSSDNCQPKIELGGWYIGFDQFRIKHQTMYTQYV